MEHGDVVRASADGETRYVRLAQRAVTSPAHAAPAAATAGASSSVTTIARAASLGHPREVYGTGHTPMPGGASK